MFRKCSDKYIRRPLTKPSKTSKAESTNKHQRAAALQAYKGPNTNGQGQHQRSFSMKRSSSKLGNIAHNCSDAEAAQKPFVDQSCKWFVSLRRPFVGWLMKFPRQQQEVLRLQ
jgi:hypothetical protein